MYVTSAAVTAATAATCQFRINDATQKSYFFLSLVFIYFVFVFHSLHCIEINTPNEEVSAGRRVRIVTIKGKGYVVNCDVYQGVLVRPRLQEKPASYRSVDDAVCTIAIHISH